MFSHAISLISILILFWQWKMESTNLTVSGTDVDIVIKNMKNGNLLDLGILI
jgi:hypothetical protein